jgi:hypothetical protein
LEKCKETVEIHCYQGTAQFPKGIQVIVNCQAMEIISLYNKECSQLVVQYSSGDNGTEAKIGTMNVQCTSDRDGPRPTVEALVQREIFGRRFKKEAERQLLR